MAGELRQLSKIGGGEAKDRKGMNFLYELTQSTNIDCPEAVARLYLMNYYWILKWNDNGWKLEDIWFGCFRSFQDHEKMKWKLKTQTQIK